MKNQFTALMTTATVMFLAVAHTPRTRPTTDPWAIRKAALALAFSTEGVSRG